MKLNSDPKRNKQVPFVLLAACVLSFIAALAVGISDNVPGILLLYISSFALVLAIVYHWTSMKRFLLLAAAAALGFVVFVVLHNFAHAGAEMAADIVVLKLLLEGVSVASFFLALLVCPPAFLVGVAGALRLFLIKHWRK